MREREGTETGAHSCIQRAAGMSQLTICLWYMVKRMMKAREMANTT